MATRNTTPPAAPATMDQTQLEASPEAAFRSALLTESVPKIYANQFWNVVQANDFAIMFGQSGVPTAVISMAYPLAKSLALRLNEAISGYEAQVGAQIPPVEVAENKLREHAEKTKQ
jgi:hypothetical protein